MAETYTFDSVEQLGAAAIGEPGKRFFFLIVGGGDGWVRVWLEKEQLRALAEGFDNLLDRIPAATEAPVPGDAAQPPDAPLLGEFVASRLAVGYDDDRDAILLLAHAPENEGDDEHPTLACRSTRAQAATLARQAVAVCNAGRSICPLCDEPIDPAGHLCPKSNGHKRTGF